MTTIVRYMYSRLTLAFLGVASVLIVNEMLYKTKELYHLVFAGVISMGELLTVWVTLMPVVLYHLSPEIVTISLLARFYLWRQHNEILTMRAMGLSCWQIALPGIMVGICAGLVCAFMAMCVLPATIGTAMKIKNAAANRIAPGMLVEGVTNTLSPELTLSFQRWLSADVIGEVVVTQDRDPEDFTFIVAERAQFAEQDGTYILVLEHGSELVHHSAQDVRPISFTQLSIPLTEPDRIVNVSGGFYDQPIDVLLNPPPEARQDPRRLAAWLSEGHHRIVNPLRCVSCALLLLGLLIPGLQGYGELIVRLLLAGALTFAETSAATVIVVLTQRHAEAIPLLYLLPVMPAAIGVSLLYWGDRLHPRWILIPALWRRKSPDAGAGEYGRGVTFANRASLE
nr:hypothetical protein Hi04_10k_c1074_00006 [uncultured bacterium]